MSKKLLYPKIETLFNRDEKTFKVIEGDYRLPEFQLVDKWSVTEKIHGINVSAVYRPTTETTGRIGMATMQKYTGREVVYRGRTDKAQIPEPILEYMSKTFTKKKFEEVFPEGDKIERFTDVKIFGEAYGPRIQKGGGNYRKDVAVRVFDVWVSASSKENPFLGWWLEPENIQDVAEKFGVKTVPPIAANYSTEDIVDLVKLNLPSIVAKEEGDETHRMEGVVARSKPLLFTRKGERLMWKLKGKDFGYTLLK